MDAQRPPETNPAFLLPANVKDNDPKVRFATAEAKPDAGKSNFDAKIEDARKQGREKLALGLQKIKEKMADLKKRIKALPGAIARLAENAVIEAFTVPARIENAVDTLNQKIEDAKAAMEKKVAEAKAKFEAQRLALLQRAQESLRQIRERSGGFFGRMRESMFKSSRKKEQEDMVEMLVLFLKKSEQGGVTASPEQFKAVADALAKIGERHRNNGVQLGDFIKAFFTTRRQSNFAAAAV